MDVTLLTIYLGRDNDARVQLYRFSQASLRDVPLDTSAVTRMLVTLVGSDPLIQFDSDLQPAAVTWNSSGLVSFDLSDYAIQAGGYPIQIVAFSPARPDGEVISDFDLSPVAIQFRDDYSSGVTPPPLVQFVPEAPEDGQLYGRRNATWEPIDDVVAGVESVNAKSGVVLLDTDDVPEGAANHYYPQADQDKLAGVEAGATANQTDAYLLNRANHTGTQPSSTIAAFGADVRAEVEAELVAGANVTITPSGTGATRQLTIAAAGVSASWGGIGGTLADQTDLVAALAEKANSADLATVAETGSYNDLADKPSIPSNTDAVAEGATNLYHTAARVLATVLSGLSLATGAAITSADSALVAFGKLQKQITDLITTVGGKQDTLVSGTNIKTINGDSLLGSGNLSISGSGAAWGGIGGTLADQTDLQAALDAKANIAAIPVRIVTASGAITPADSGYMIISTSATPITLTIGAEATAAWAISGSAPMIHFLQDGAGAVTITGDGFSVTTHASDTNVLDGQIAAATAVWRGTDAWRLFGRLVAA